MEMVIKRLQGDQLDPVVEVPEQEVDGASPYSSRGMEWREESPGKWTWNVWESISLMAMMVPIIFTCLCAELACSVLAWK